MTSRESYIAEYADDAMMQMKRYGIPASVILAQGIIESANGKSQLSQEANNHFGVKGTYNGNYVLADDDKPNEKFKKYDNVGQSYEDHSKVLMADRYHKLTKNLSHDDYKGWAKAIKAGGYATSSTYVSTICSVIEKNNLQQYDQQVMAEMKSDGKKFGVESNPLQTTVSNGSSQSDATGQKGNTGFSLPDGTYSMPIKKEGFLLVTSPFGKRVDPMDHSKMQFHQGIDIHARGDALLATENNGKVVKASNDINTGGGKTVTVEYTREDGTKTQCVYMHMSKIDVKVGDVVNAGDKLGVSGNTGTRTTGEHLHFGVKAVDASGKQEYVNPASYLAEINAHGNLKTQALYNGKDLMASYTASNGQKNTEVNLSPEDWTKKLLSSEDFGSGLSGSSSMLEKAFMLFSTLLALVSQVEGKNQEEKMQSITDAVTNKSINLSGMVPTVKACSLNVLENGKLVLHVENANGKFNHEMTDSETTKLSGILHGDADDTTKAEKVTNFVNGIVLSQQASENYEQIAEQQRQQEQSQRIK